MDRDDPAEDELSEEEEYTRKSRGLKGLYEKTKWFWIAIIVFGLVTASLRHSTMSHGTSTLIDMSQIAVTLALLAEVIVRFVVDWRDFFHHRHNWADLALAIITSIMLLPPIRHSGMGCESRFIIGAQCSNQKGEATLPT